MILHPTLQVPELDPGNPGATESRHPNRIIPRVVLQSSDYDCRIGQTLIVE